MAPPTQQYKQGSVTCEGLCLSLVASPAFVTFSPSFFVSLLPFYDMTLWGKTHIFGIPLCPLPKIRITLPLSTDACEKILFFACLFCSASPPPPPTLPVTGEQYFRFHSWLSCLGSTRGRKGVFSASVVWNSEGIIFRVHTAELQGRMDWVLGFETER